MFRPLNTGRTLVNSARCCTSNHTSRMYVIKHRSDMLCWSWLQERFFSGEGEGKGGGSGGSIKSAGGAFGKMEVAHEEMFFREQQARQIKELKSAMKDTLKAKLSHHEAQLAVHMDGMKRHKEQMSKKGNIELHKFHMSQHEDAVTFEREEINKIHDTWKKMQLD